MKKFGKIGKVIGGLEFDKGVAALIGALGALGSLVFAAISSARNLGEDEPIDSEHCDLLKHNQAETEDSSEETVEAEEPAEPDEA